MALNRGTFRSANSAAIRGSRKDRIILTQAITYRVIGQMCGGAGPPAVRVTKAFRPDHDTIVVKAPFDNFRRLKLKVTDAS